MDTLPVIPSALPTVIPNTPPVIPSALPTVIPNTPPVIPSRAEGSQGSLHSGRDDNPRTSLSRPPTVIPSRAEGSLPVIPNRRSSERKAMLASTLPSRDGGRRSHEAEGTPNVIPSAVEGSQGSLHSGRDDKPQSSLGHNDPAEVKASSPIRTSLFEREGSMWGSLKRPSLRRSPVIPSPHPTVIPSPLPSVIPSGAEGSQGSLHSGRDDNPRTSLSRPPTVIPSPHPTVIPSEAEGSLHFGRDDNPRTSLSRPPTVIPSPHPLVISNRRSSESKAMLASTLPSRDGGRRSHAAEESQGSLHSGRDDKPQSSLGHNDPAEVKASSPIRTSLYEREGSMWGSLKRPSLRRSPVIPSPHPTVISSTHPLVIPSGAEGSQRSLHALRLVEMTRGGRSRDLFPYTFKALSEELSLPPEGLSMVDSCRADDSELCLEAVANGWLTEAQMRHAADRYRLGKSRQGKTIYWLIDQHGLCRDGHVGDTWISEILKRRYPEVANSIHPRHCLFGLHLLYPTPSPSPQRGGELRGDNPTPSFGHPSPQRGGEYVRRLCSPQRGGELKYYSPPKVGGARGGLKPIAIVESERSAVILSELYPQTNWLATVYPANFTVDQLEPLRGYKVTLFPRTDPAMDNYVAWLEIADQARRLYHLDITVSSLLEDHATEDQKSRCIDLLEFLFTNHL